MPMARQALVFPDPAVNEDKFAQTNKKSEKRYKISEHILKRGKPMSMHESVQTTQHTADLLSNPEYVINLIEKSKASHRWLGRHRAELVEKYPDQWAGADENGLAATASTRTELIEALKSQGTDLKTAAICLLETKPMVLIL